MKSVLRFLAFAGLAVALAPVGLADSPNAQWVWYGGDGIPDRVALRQSFEVSGDVKQARIAATCDNGFTLWVNGKEVLKGNSWEKLEAADVKPHLKAGKNQVSVLATNEGGAAGFLARLDIHRQDGSIQSLVTDKSWKTWNQQASGLRGNWHAADVDESRWVAAKELGAVGASGLPWSGQIKAASLEEAATRAPSMRASVDKSVKVPAGFRVEKLFDVPSSMGSWVSVGNYGDGRLVVSDQNDAGLFLVKPAELGNPDAESEIVPLPVDLTSAQGLLWAHDSLYVVVNGAKSGMYRATDTDGDGLVDDVKTLFPIPGAGEHGPHAVVLAPDGQSLMVAAGNHTKLPEGITGSRLPMNWDEDHLLPRRWDANGHAVGILAPGGWILKTDSEGKTREVVSMGYRNQYDVAFNADGELFTYDSDMEWDFGMPWYRPTRVNHATSGSEFGWRSGTGVWPTYFEDSLPAAANIGPGSPVGIHFGYGAKFPAKYQKALFLLDWTYSTIYAVHLTPDGASYAGEVEDFAFGQPLQVTDGVVGADGAFYFTVGGRKTHSALYRITYQGDESTEPVSAGNQRDTELRQLRQQLEAFHHAGDADLDFIWEHLAHEDRFISYAARVALEQRPVDSWRAKALAESHPRRALLSLMALARQGQADDRAAVVAALGKIDVGQLDEPSFLTLMRNYQLAFIRLGEPSDQERKSLIAKFSPMFPTDSEKRDAELIQLLVYLGDPAATAKGVAMMNQLAAETEPVPDWSELAKRNAGYGGTVQAMLDNMPPMRAMHYAFVLRNATVGWTPELRRDHLNFFSRMAQHPGGASYPGFIRQIRDDAWATIPVSEQPLYDDIVSAPLGGKPFDAQPPKGPGRQWTVAEASEILGTQIRGANFASGENLYHATSCSKCHRFAGEGGAIGPDLSTAGVKFSVKDLLDAIIEPSKAISDQYGSHQILTVDGTTLVGRVVDLGDQYQVYTADVNLPPQVIAKDDVEEIQVSNVSQMPTGTIDGLSPQELKNLIGYILSGGNRRAEYFRN